MKDLIVAERLIVAADFKPIVGCHSVEEMVLNLADLLYGTGVYLKINSALRLGGYGLINKIHDRGLKVFADLKLNDIPETLATDGAILRSVNPELLTVMCDTGDAGMKALKTELPNTEVLGVTVLTSLKEEGAHAIYGCSLDEAVVKLALMAELAGADGLIASAKEAGLIRSLMMKKSMTINTPGIRPTWSIVQGDDQDPNRILTPAKAIKAGADRIVVGRPILRACSPRAAVDKILEEIADALAMA